MKVWLGVVVVILALATLPMPSRADNAAVVINGLGCGLIDGNGGFVTTDDSHAVITSNGNGLFVCKATVTPAAGGGSVRYSALECGTPAGLTDDAFEEVSASGQATLSCHVH